MATTETKALLTACKDATAVRVGGLDPAFAAMETALADAVSESFALMRKWRAMELADPGAAGALEEYKQTLGALERESAKALQHVQAVRRIAKQFEDVDARLQERFR